MFCGVDNHCIKKRINLGSSSKWYARIHLPQIPTLSTRDFVFWGLVLLPKQLILWRRGGRPSPLKASNLSCHTAGGQPLGLSGGKAGIRHHSRVTMLPWRSCAKGRLCDHWSGCHQTQRSLSELSVLWALAEKLGCSLDLSFLYVSPFKAWQQ